MTVEQANGNYNYMYEFRIDELWHPCHLLDVYADKLQINRARTMEKH